MSNPINPWEQETPSMDHTRLLEVLDLAFKQWLQNNPRELSDNDMFVTKQLIRLLVISNSDKVDNYYREKGMPDERG